MGRTAKNALKKDFFQVELNVGDVVNGEHVDLWQSQTGFYGQLVYTATTKGLAFDKKNETLTLEIFVSPNPKLTLSHRLLYKTRLLYYKGSYEPKNDGKLTVIWVSEQTVEQPWLFMNMQGIGLGGFTNVTHQPTGGSGLAGVTITTHQPSGGVGIAGATV